MKNYKYSWTVDQRSIIESGLNVDLVDFSILRMLMDFATSDGCRKMHEGAVTFYCFRWTLVRDQLPILKLNTRQSVKKRIKKLMDANIIAAHPDNQKTRSAWFKFCPGKDLLFNCKRKLPSDNESLQQTKKGTDNESYPVTTKVTQCKPKLSHTDNESYQDCKPKLSHTDNESLHYNTNNNNINNITTTKDKKGHPESGQMGLKEDSPKKEDQSKPEEQKAQRLTKQSDKQKKNKKSKTPALPFQSEEFAQIWEDWTQHRKEIKKTLTPTTITRQLKKLSVHDEDTAIWMLNNAIEKGWVGFFPPDKKKGEGPAPKSDTPIKDGYDALEKKMEEENWTVEDIFRIANSNQFTNQQNEA